KRDYAGARKSLETALTMDPDSLEAMLAMAQLEQSEGSLDNALARYEKLMAKNPDNAGIALLTASLLERKGDPVKAKAIYEDVLKKNPNAAPAANNLAFYYAEYEPTKDNIAKAEKLIAPLLEKHANVPHVVDTAAWVYYRKGEYEKARGLLLSVYESASRFPAIQYHLGMTYLRLGDNEKARTHLQLALKGREQYPGRTEAEKELKAISK
ncbi:MAG TPA: tetratricopeptide repeat protein, partial [Syntrophales bacterium]|nr:tetratricopeptide repeat protein [Syntrophales bacterium]